MNLRRQILSISFLVLFLGLSFGFEVYRVHCDMRESSFLSLTEGKDPCHAESSNLASSCCSAKATCFSDFKNNDEDSCCEEEEITLSYSPDFFNQVEVEIPLIVCFFLAPNINRNPIFVELNSLNQLCQYPHPPPKQGRDILSLISTLRI